MQPFTEQLRGRVLNVESAPASRVFENKELTDVVTALGCGIGKTFDIGKQTFWALDDTHRDAIVNAHTNGRGNPEITRFKGLSEMMPKVLWETTLNPETRRLLRVAVDDQHRTDRVIANLMGKDPSARFRFIMGRADEALDLDV